jgi:ABC-type multidrug transport system ATPase subunit
VITIEDLTVSFGGTPVVHGVSFAVAEGESFALVGESGSGKSTILKALSGQVADWTGR